MQEETPEWIDYDAAGNGGTETANFRSYWYEQLTKHFGQIPQQQWTVKSLSQVKNFMNEFGDKDWRQMIYQWMQWNKGLSRARNVSMFYAERYSIWQAVNPQEKSWEW